MPEDPSTGDHSVGCHDDVFRITNGLRIASRTTMAVVVERLTGNTAVGVPELPV